MSSKPRKIPELSRILAGLVFGRIFDKMRGLKELTGGGTDFSEGMFLIDFMY